MRAASGQNLNRHCLRGLTGRFAAACHACLCKHSCRHFSPCCCRSRGAARFYQCVSTCNMPPPPPPTLTHLPCPQPALHFLPLHPHFVCRVHQHTLSLSPARFLCFFSSSFLLTMAAAMRQQKHSWKVRLLQSWQLAPRVIFCSRWGYRAGCPWKHTVLLARTQPSQRMPFAHIL